MAKRSVTLKPEHSKVGAHLIAAGEQLGIDPGQILGALLYDFEKGVESGQINVAGYYAQLMQQRAHPAPVEDSEANSGAWTAEPQQPSDPEPAAAENLAEPASGEGGLNITSG